MAPSKFGLFKARSRDYQDQPSTENLLQNSNSSENVATPSSPVPSTSKAPDDEEAPYLSPLHGHDLVVQDDLDIMVADASTSTIGDDDLLTLNDEDEKSTLAMESDQDGASTSCDANSIQFDETSIAPSEDLSVYCGQIKKNKKNRSKEEEKLLRDFCMWRASNVEVMQNLLSRSGTQDDQIKWEAIATARGLCTLTDNCSCGDCSRTKYLNAIADGDGGLGAAPLFSAISFGCSLQ